MVHILYSHIFYDNHSVLIEELLPKYSLSFQQDINEYHRWEDAQLSLLGRELLFHGLQKMGNSRINRDLAYSEFGKPYFIDDSVNFNISHSGEIAICALIDGYRAGIDIEEKKTQEFKGFKSRMTNSEWDTVISSRNQSDAFLTYWTQKEAVLKAHGQGLSVPLQSFEIINDKTKVNQDTFFLKQIEIDEKYTCFIASDLCLDTASIQIEEITLKDLVQARNNTIRI